MADATTSTFTTVSPLPYLHMYTYLLTYLLTDYLQSRPNLVRQEIAATWPMSLDDSIARADWGWAPRHVQIEYSQ